VKDDGVGFDPMAVDREVHFGLQLLAERVDAAQGVLYVNSQPGGGTTLVATLPADEV
jgi:signal transduction histidine kinase